MERIVRRWRVGLLCLFFLVAMTRPVGATGPFDGIWFVDQLCPSVGFLNTFAVSITENDAAGTPFNLVAVVLDFATETWSVDIGTRINSTVQGQIFNAAGTLRGTFTVTASSPTSFTGTAQIEGVSCSLHGTKVF